HEQAPGDWGRLQGRRVERESHETLWSHAVSVHAYMKRRLLNAATSEPVSSNHSPFLRRSPNLSCQYRSIPERSSVAITWTCVMGSGSLIARSYIRRPTSPVWPIL